MKCCECIKYRIHVWSFVPAIFFGRKVHEEFYLKPNTSQITSVYLPFESPENIYQPNHN